MEQARPLLEDTTTDSADLELEVHRLRRTLDAIARAAGRGPSQPVVGVLDPAGDPGQDDEVERGVADTALSALRMGIAVMELRRRLAGYRLRQYTLSSQPAVSELGEEVVESLCPWEDSSGAALAAEVDGLVVLPGPVSEASARALMEVEQAGIPVHRLPAGDGHADPLVLAPRLADEAVLGNRREYLVVSGLLPSSDPYVLWLDGEAPPAPSERGGRAVVRPAQPLLPIDLLALVRSADLVVTSSPAVAALAEAFCRPFSPGEDPLPDTKGTDRGARAERSAVLASLADRTFDDLYRALIDSTGGRLAQTVPQRLQSLERRVATLEAANAGLRRALSRERSVMAAEVRRREEPPGENEAPWSAFHAERMARDLDAAQMEIARLHAEIQNINSSRAVRVVRAAAPARRVYGRARRLIRRS